MNPENSGHGLSQRTIQTDRALLEEFGRGMRENFASGSIPFCKAYLQPLLR